MYSWGMPKLSEVVRDARKARRMTQEELAEAIGKSVSWVGMLETDKLDRPKRAELRALASTLQLPVEDMLVAMGQMDAAPEDVAILIQRIAGLPTPEARLAAVNDLPEPVFQAIAVLTRDLVAAKAEQLEELVGRLSRGQ